MNNKDKTRILDFYHQSLKEFGEHDARALQWSNEENQRTRFNVLQSIANSNHQKILDVGCGVGDLYKMLLERKLSVDYTGIDIIPEYIQIAKSRYPDAHFFEKNIENMNAENEQFDYIFASGSLNFKVEDNKNYYFAMIKKMYALAKKGVAFNMLDYDSHIDNETYASYKSGEVADFCKTFCDDVQIITNYLPQDFTVYLYK